MEQEQVNMTTIQNEPTVDQPADQNDKPKENSWVAPATEEEYNKALQSAASKAKYALLQELNIKSVDDYKAKVSQYETAINESKSLKEANTKYQEQINDLNETLVMEKMGVDDAFKDDLLTLAKAKVTDEIDFSKAVEMVLEKNPTWRRDKEPVRIGTEKTNVRLDANEDDKRKKAVLSRLGI